MSNDLQTQPIEDRSEPEGLASDWDAGAPPRHALPETEYTASPVSPLESFQAREAADDAALRALLDADPEFPRRRTRERRFAPRESASASGLSSSSSPTVPSASSATSPITPLRPWSLGD